MASFDMEQFVLNVVCVGNSLKLFYPLQEG